MLFSEQIIYVIALNIAKFIKKQGFTTRQAMRYFV